ncbi:MAG: hypothetical protein M5U12_10130 [Verrucomicrobia bacterium]|nr:hypothetical protein [Verrucomicrobiota bacterium]
MAKELRLQSPAFVVGGLYVLICGTDLVLQWAWPRPGELSLTSEVTSFVTLFHVLLVTLLAGALACAEDRATGVLPWHLTLPIALRTQWRVKVGVALGTALALGVALPGIVLGLGRSPILNELAGPAWLAVVLAAAVLCALGLYLSSLGEHDARLALGRAARAVGRGRGRGGLQLGGQPRGVVERVHAVRYRRAHLDFRGGDRLVAVLGSRGGGPVGSGAHGGRRETSGGLSDGARA